MANCYHKELAVAEEAVRRASTLCQAVRDHLPPDALTKDDKSPVTVADYGAQAVICKQLSEEFPDDPVVAEEDASDLPDDVLVDVQTHVQRVVVAAEDGDDDETVVRKEDVRRWIDHGNGSTNQKRFWTLDPIDGTCGYLRGDQYAICLALIEDGDVRVGVLGCPSLHLDDRTTAGGCLFTAVRGQGTVLKSLSDATTATTGPPATKVHVSQQSDASSSESLRFVESVEASHGNHQVHDRTAKAVGITADPIRMDSQAKYGIVATGGAALYLRLPRNVDYRENIWDHAAGTIVVEEAGGRVTDMDGKALDFCSSYKMQENRGVVVSNGIIHDQVLMALKDL